MVTAKKIQVRLPDDSYELMMRLLGPNETISDFIRRAVELQNTLRLLAKNELPD